ncbi:hypothetical protein E6P97_03240 [Patescibacteria group bacterium]|nr:MAG: hypothetical protein E6P97_03240 [Patescibacteria group bacterium]
MRYFSFILSIIPLMRKKSPPLITERLATMGVGASAVIICALPFHAFVTTWLGSQIGAYDLVRSWKEALLLLGILLAIAVVVSDSTRRWQQLLKQTPILWILGYACLTLLCTFATLLQSEVTRDALLYGLMIQLRFLCFFGLLALFSLYNDFIYQYWQRLLFVPASVVIGFGLLQVFVLPADFLTNFGYGPDTIPAVQTIDNKSEYQRIQSTLRGANPYGAYLVLIITALVVRLWKQARDYRTWLLLAGAAVNLYCTYSRSAWAGLLLSLLVVGLTIGRRYIKPSLIAGAAVLAVLSLATVWTLRDNDYVQNILFHSDETSISAQSSNEQRGQGLARSFEEIVGEPLGGGIGSAGPASFRNQPEPPQIAENYFIQAGQEMGWLGIIGLLGVMIAFGRWLVRYIREPLALVLFASLVGVTLINLVSHAWADDTLSLVWWGLAGAYMGYAILNKDQTKSKLYGTQKEK